MITQAAMMPSLAAAVFRLDDEMRAVRLGSNGTSVECNRQVGMLLAHGATRASFLPDVPDESALLDQLRLVTAGQRALTFILASADSELDQDNRLGSLVCAERLVSEGRVRDFVKHRLLGCPPPPDASFTCARDLARNNDCKQCEALYEVVLRFGQAIQPALQALKDVLYLDHMEDYDQEAVLHALVDHGVVAEAVLAFASHDRQRTKLLPVEFGAHPALRLQVVRLPHVLTEFSKKLVQDLPAETPPIDHQDVEEEQVRLQDPWVVAVEGWLEERRMDKSKRGVPGWHNRTHDLRTRGGELVRLRPHYDADVKLAQVEKQAEYVIRLMNAGNESLEQTILDLIAHQRRNSEPEHLCMTLSLLGHQATKLRAFGLALRLYRVAKLANDTDHVAFCGSAETLRTMGQLKEALAAYGEARQLFPNESVPFCGYAETLRSMSRLQEALTTYDKARQRFPDDAVPFNGYAETLRSMGQLQKALEAYEEAKQRFPNDGVPFCGYAETLRSEGKLQEALVAYDGARQRFTSDPVPFNGYAETLRSMGQFQDALAAYEEARQRFPENAVPFCGYAETLRSMGRFQDALAAYDPIRQRFRNNAISFCGYAETLRNAGQLQKALEAYEEAKQRFPNDEVPFSGYAETLRELRRLDDAVRAYENLSRRFPYSRVVANALACLLVEAGNLQGASELLRTGSPCSRADWRDFHLSTMIALWSGNSELAHRQLEIAMCECPFFDGRAIFECTLAALNLREQRTQPSLTTVHPERVVPFPSALVVYVHMEAENQRSASAEVGLRMLRLPQFQGPADHLKRLYGLAGEQRVPQWQEEEVREALWQEERMLLLRAA